MDHETQPPTPRPRDRARRGREPPLRVRRRAGALAALLVLLGAYPAALEAAFENAMRAALAGWVPPEAFTEAQAVQLRSLYAAREDAPLWVDHPAFAHRLAAMREVLENAGAEGLDPEDYQVHRLELPSPPKPESMAALDLRITEALGRYVSELRTGRARLRRTDATLFIHPGSIDLKAALAGALEASELRTYLETFVPASRGYRNLRRLLGEYRELARAGGWPSVPDAIPIRPGDAGPAVAALRARLEASGDISVPPAAGSRFDPALEQALQRFQARHGLEPDGIIGQRTLAALNVPVADRITQILVNMERWRWLPDDLGERHVLVNLAGFELELVVAEQPVQRMRIVVGKPYLRTPVFSDRIRYLELNPTWTVPPRIAGTDLLPKIRRDPDFLAREGFTVYASWDAGAPRLDPGAIDWSAVSAAEFPYRLVQAPGPTNALGWVKFMFPNEHQVYLHDTPARELFDRRVRTLSSGCIRVERPLELAAALLAPQGWSGARLGEAIAQGSTRVVRLDEPVPVHLTYNTAWLGDDGTRQFRDDVYGRDAMLRRALEGT